MPVEFIAEGRIVWGHPGNAQIKTDPRTKQKKLDDTGKPIEQWVFGLAIEKNAFNEKVYPAMYQEALTAFPSGQFPQNFSWKFKDGDTATDAKGKPYREMEGRAGCMILTISTEAFAPPLYKINPQTGAYDQITADQIDCGDYVAVSIMCKYNGATGVNTPGLYINPQGVVHTAYGEKIVSSGFDVDEKFAGFTAQLPPGASATPVMGSAPVPGAMQGQTAPTPQTAPVPLAQAAASGNLPPPAHDFVNNAGQVPASPPTTQNSVPTPTPVPAPQPQPVAQPAPVPGQFTPGTHPQGR